MDMIDCPHCGQEIEIESLSDIGEEITCPRCGREFDVELDFDCI